MDYSAMYGAAASILNCLAAQYPSVKTLVGAAASIIGGATMLFKVGQTQTAGGLNALFPSWLSTAFSGIGGFLGKISFSK